jgi:hypothetical protein
VLGEDGIKIAPSTYYARNSRTPLARTVHDASGISLHHRSGGTDARVRDI